MVEKERGERMWEVFPHPWEPFWQVGPAWLTHPPQIRLPPSLPMGKRGRLMEGVSEVEWRKAIVGMEGKQRRLTIGSCTYITHISINVICVYVCMYVSISFPVIPPP